MRILEEALTFDDVLLVPAYSEVLPREVSLASRLTREISVNLPVVSAAMDTVTEARLAITMAQEGGIGIIHKNMSIENQARQVDRVKKFESGVISDPITVKPDMTIREVIELTRAKNISGVPVVVGTKVVGIVTHRDLRFETKLDAPVSSVMTPKERLITVRENAPKDEVLALLHKHRIEKVLVVGELNVDLIGTGLQTFPVLGREIIAQEMVLTLGSSSAILVCGLARLGVPVTFISKVGKDDFGKFCLDALESKKVKTESVIRDAKLRTGLTVSLNFRDDKAQVTYPGAIPHLYYKDIPPKTLRQSDHLHVSSFFLQDGLLSSFPQLFQDAKQLGGGAAWTGNFPFAHGVGAILRRQPAQLRHVSQRQAPADSLAKPVADGLHFGTGHVGFALCLCGIRRSAVYIVWNRKSPPCLRRYMI